MEVSHLYTLDHTLRIIIRNNLQFPKLISGFCLTVLPPTLFSRLCNTLTMNTVMCFLTIQAVRFVRFVLCWDGGEMKNDKFNV